MFAALREASIGRRYIDEYRTAFARTQDRRIKAGIGQLIDQRPPAQPAPLHVGLIQQGFQHRHHRTLARAVDIAGQQRAGLVNGLHRPGPGGNHALGTAAVACQRPVQETLIHQRQQAFRPALIGGGDVGQRIDLPPVALDAHFALVEARLILGDIAFYPRVDQVRERDSVRRPAVSVMVDDDADVDQIIEKGRMAVGHDLRPVDGDDGGAIRRLPGGNRGVKGFALRKGSGRTKIFFVTELLTSLQAGANALPVRGVVL